MSITGDRLAPELVDDGWSPAEVFAAVAAFVLVLGYLFYFAPWLSAGETPSSRGSLMVPAPRSMPPPAGSVAQFGAELPR